MLYLTLLYLCLHSHTTSLLLFFIVDYLILWLSCPLFLEWLAHLQDCKCGNTPCDLTPAILARLLQTFSHADLIKYSLEVAQRKMILDPIFLPLKSPDILITPKGKLKDKKVIHFTVEELFLLTFDTNVVKISILEYQYDDSNFQFISRFMFNCSSTLSIDKLVMHTGLKWT